MKISINTAQYFSNVDLKAIGKEALVEKIGSQLGAVDEVVDWAPKYEGIVIARVASCVDHPNADTLHICKVDDGGVVQDVERDENGYVQVVCGAPNVREGLLVAWIPPGATVPTTVNTSEPFVLGKRELRGVISNGMLASAAELGLSDNHDGLLEINESETGRELSVGEPFVSIYSLDDVVIDVENKMFTHRPDCFGVLGVAREIAGITQQAYISPSWYLETPEFAQASDLDLRISVEIPELVPRFMAVALKNVHIKPSPNWLQSALTRIGIRPINNVVDVTNFVMYVTAQPLHAYDYDKVAKRSSGDGAEIIVRHPRDNEQITLLSGKQITPRAEAIMIASSNDLIGVGGVMGGADTEVDESTTNVILEVASFDMYSIRRTAMAHGLFTDAVTRFNKGQSPLQNDRVLAYAMEQLAQLAEAEQASEVIDSKAALLQNPTLRIKPDFINARLGLNLPIGEMHALLNNVEFAVSVDGDELQVTAPFWRTDISIAEDIVEEIGRLYGFDRLPLTLPQRPTEPTPKDAMLELKKTVRHTLKNSGANEVLTYSFVHKDLLDRVGQDSQDAYSLSNALSPSLQFYRLSITPSLLEKVHPNQKAGFDEFALFELGKAHSLRNGLQDGVPVETEALAYVYAASAKAVQKDAGAAFYKAKYALDYLAKSLNVEILYAPVTDAVESPYEAKRSAVVIAPDGTKLGVIGEFTQKAITTLKLPKHSAGFELNTAALLGAVSSKSTYTAISKFPKVSQDISLKVDTGISFSELNMTLNEALAGLQPKDSRATLSPLDIYTDKDADVSKKHVTFRLEIASFTGTLIAEDVNALLDAIADVANQKLGAERI